MSQINITKHIDGHKHVFIKNGIIENVCVFEEFQHGDEIINQVKSLYNADEVVDLCYWFSNFTGEYIGEPGLYWSWDGENFEPATQEYLESIGVATPNMNIAE